MPSSSAVAQPGWASRSTPRSGASRVALVERGDFGQGTSSRSTKLVHGGVRYLAQGDFRLVYEALRERANLLANAPHIAQPLSFVMPAYKLWQMPFYGAGLKAYDVLAGAAGIGPTRWMGPARVREMLPTVKSEGLLGGVSYWDGQFDDARLAIAIARTAQAHGATLANYCVAQSVAGDGSRIAGVNVVDRESGNAFLVRSRCVVNATGVWADKLLGKSSRRPAAAAGRAQPGRAPQFRPCLPAGDIGGVLAPDQRRPRALRDPLAGQDHRGHHGLQPRRTCPASPSPCPARSTTCCANAPASSRRRPGARTS